MPSLVRVSRPFPGPGALVALLLLVSACGGETPGSPPPPPPVPPPPPPPIDGGLYEGVACPALQPARAAGQPLERIGLGQVPGSFQAPLFAYVREQGGAAQGFSLVELSEAGALELVVPIHPSGSPAGGPARVWISDGTRACAAFDFTVQALPPAPGEFATIVGLVQALVAQQAAALGTTPAELQSLPPGQVPPELLGVAVAQALVDHPGTDRSLVAVAAGTSPISSTLPLALLESVLARAGLRTALETAVAPAATAGRSRDPGGRPRRPAGQADGQGCTPADVGTSVEELDRCMRLRHELGDKVEGGEGLEHLGALLAVVATQLGVSLHDVDGAREARSVVNLLEWATLVPALRGMGALPDWPLGGTVEATPAVFAEDDPGPGTWTLKVIASSRGYSIEKHTRQNLDRAIEKMGRPLLIGLLRLAGANEVVNAMLSGDPAALDVAPVVFQPVDVSEEPWSESSFPPEAAVVRRSHASYAPRAVGVAPLTVIAKVSPAWTSFLQPIEVREIEMAISPREVVLAAGEEVEFTVTVTGTHAEEAVDTVLRGSAPRGTVVSRQLLSWTAGEAGRTEVYRLRYRAPALPGVDQALEVGLKHTARTGARAAPAAPVREAVAEVRFGKVEISPSGICLEPGASQTFTATVTGLTSQAVNWTASSGNITSNGVYTAAAGTPPGTEVTITATSRVNDKFKDEVTLQVGGCGCTFNLTVGTMTVEAMSGDRLSYQVIPDFAPGAGTIFGTFITRPGPEGPTARVTLGSLEDPGAGVFTRILTHGLIPPDVGFIGEDVTVILADYRPGERLIGEAMGTVDVASSGSDVVRLEPFHLSFRIVLPPGYEPGTIGHLTYTCIVP